MELASVTGKCNFPSVLKGLSLARNLDVRMLDSPSSHQLYIVPWEIRADLQ